LYLIDWITARLDLTAFRDNFLLISCQKNAIECINQCVLEEERSRDDIDQSGTFTKGQKNGRECSQWSVYENQDRNYWKVSLRL
jgi:hypothetical protein